MEVQIRTAGQQLANIFLSGMPGGRALESALAAQIDSLILAAEQRGAGAERERIIAILRNGKERYQADGAVWFHIGALDELIDDLTILG